jgi:hypothetical protein
MVPLTKPLSENNAHCLWVPYPRQYQWFHMSSPGPEGLGDSTWSLQNLLPLVIHGPDYVRRRIWVHEFPLVPLIPRGSTVLPGHPKTPELLNGGHYRDDTSGSTCPHLDPKVWAILHGPSRTCYHWSFMGPSSSEDVVGFTNSRWCL